MFDFIAKNPGVIFSSLVLIGTWLIMFGSLRSDIKTLKETQDEHKKKHADNEMRWTEHIQDDTPHKSCLVELRAQEGTSESITELRRAISRIEGWVMAMAAQAGVKRPIGNGD